MNTRRPPSARKPRVEPQKDLTTYHGDFALFKRDGLTLLLDRTSLVDQVMISGGGWEPWQVELMRHAAHHILVPNHGVFLDIGAFWGLYTMQAIAAGVPEVHTFEPDRRNYAQLQAQLFLNDMIHLTNLHQCAVSAQSGEVMFRESVKGQNPGSAGIVEDEAMQGTRVESIALDNLFDWTGRSIVIKLDIEGHECAALQGMKRLVSSNRCFMQVEAFEDTRAHMLAVAQNLGLRHIFTVPPIDHYLTNLAPTELGWFYVAAAKLGLLQR